MILNNFLTLQTITNLPFENSQPDNRYQQELFQLRMPLKLAEKWQFFGRPPLFHLTITITFATAATIVYTCYLQTNTLLCHLHAPCYLYTNLENMWFRNILAELYVIHTQSILSQSLQVQLIGLEKLSHIVFEPVKLFIISIELHTLSLIAPIR